MKLKRAMWNRPYTTNEIFDDDIVDTQATDAEDVSQTNKTNDINQANEASDTYQIIGPKVYSQTNGASNQPKMLDLQPAKRKPGRPKGSRKKNVKPQLSPVSETIATRTRSKNL